jgi:peptidoglycan/LPS O-acetylase OafA/YrhL
VAQWYLLRRGRLGVELFFAISGFLITTLLLRERRDTGRISLRSFYTRRTLRIFPPYYTILAVYIGLVMVGARHESG